MARPIKETPILFGEDARRFEERMKENRTESPEQREIRLKHYQIMLTALQKGEEDRKQGTMPNCIVSA